MQTARKNMPLSFPTATKLVEPNLFFFIGQITTFNLIAKLLKKKSGHPFWMPQ